MRLRLLRRLLAAVCCLSALVGVGILIGGCAGVYHLAMLIWQTACMA